jgi:hypothetical protein
MGHRFGIGRGARLVRHCLPGPAVKATELGVAGTFGHTCPGRARCGQRADGAPVPADTRCWARSFCCSRTDRAGDNAILGSILELEASGEAEVERLVAFLGDLPQSLAIPAGSLGA